jgi:hypothetical protein
MVDVQTGILTVIKIIMPCVLDATKLLSKTHGVSKPEPSFMSSDVRTN